MDILKEPTQIFNGHETAFQLCSRLRKALAPIHENIYETIQAAAKLNITVIFTFSASESLPPSMIIYPYKRLPSSIAESKESL